jgi:LuxR family maltose regulon positive regulatory protein
VEQLLSTKLYIPPIRPELVPRPRLVEQLNQGLHRKLTLISAPAGFGKTALVTEWLDKFLGEANNENQINYRVAWLSLEDDDNDLVRFLSYSIAALNRAAGNDTAFGKGALSMLYSPQPAPVESVLTSLINEFDVVKDKFIFVLDDYHVVEIEAIENALKFLIEHLPPQIHLVIATREDPRLPLPGLRAKDQVTELRVTDLRFTTSEASAFLNQVMGLNLSAEDIAALEARTEGWIAGLQLAAISMQGHDDAASFIKSFTGSHHFVLDYLIEEVLEQQTESIQSFLPQTAILDRMSGTLCDAVRFGFTKKANRSQGAAITGHENSQQILEYLERANLFIVPLDNERCWYRYHHLFAELLQQRLRQSTTSSTGDESGELVKYHIRASEWYEENGLEIEAFHHATAAGNIARAARLAEGEGMPLHLRGALSPVLNWLESLPTPVLDARPSLWVMYGSALLLAGKLTSIEPKLKAAEAALQGAELDDKTKDLLGYIATGRATLAALMVAGQQVGAEQKLQDVEGALQVTESDDKTEDLMGQITPLKVRSGVSQQQVEEIITQSRLALEYLDPDNLSVRTAAN